MVKRLAILGSTGSIGRQTLQVVNTFPERFQVVALAAGRNAELLAEQIRVFRPQLAVIASGDGARLADAAGKTGTEILLGTDGLVTAAGLPGVDAVVVAVAGMVGLRPTLAALAAGKDVYLANKETLVAGGQLVKDAWKSGGGGLLPVDSEHSAIFQCLQGHPGCLAEVTLTASGGPLRQLRREQLREVTPAMALAHPTWQMGKKITVDSATLMNKGLEVIEARWLFDLDFDRIKVLIHPQSVVHSLVTLVDGSVLAQMGVSDMRIPIQYALSWPERWPNSLPRLNLAALGKLEFEEPRWDDFPALGLAYQAGRQGGTATTILNAANEVAVAAFLQGRIGFGDLAALVAGVLDRSDVLGEPDLAAVLRADAWAREQAETLIGKGAGRQIR